MHGLLRLVVLATIPLGGLLPTNVHADWPRFRGADGSGSSSDPGLPVTWSDSENIAWKTALPGPGSSSPVAWGDRIFLTCYSGYAVDATSPGNRANLLLHTVCLDRNGRVLWDRTMPASSHEQDYEGQLTNHGYATPTPATDGNAVFCYFGVSGVVAYDYDGNQLWTAQTGERTAGFGCSASPVLFENLVIVNASIEDQALIAFDKQTGSVVWRVEGVERAWNTPIIAELPGGEPELIMNCDSQIKGLRPSTGEELWTCQGIADYISPSPVAHDGVVYAIGGRPRESFAVRLGGRGDVTESHRLWFGKSGANVVSPVFYQNRIYFLDDRAVFHSVDAANGEFVYRERVPAGNRVYASVVRAGDVLFAQTRDQGVLVVKTGDEFELLAQNRFESDDSLFNASPAIDGGLLLLRSDKFLYAIAKTTP